MPSLLSVGRFSNPLHHLLIGWSTVCTQSLRRIKYLEVWQGLNAFSLCDRGLPVDFLHSWTVDIDCAHGYVISDLDQSTQLRPKTNVGLPVRAEISHDRILARNQITLHIDWGARLISIRWQERRCLYLAC